MKLSYFICLFCIVAIFGLAPQPASADDFGNRFFNQAPKGLGDFTAESDEIPDVAMDDLAQDLQDIMPASGDETDETSDEDDSEKHDNSDEDADEIDEDESSEDDDYDE